MTKKKNKMLKATVASVLVTASLPASALAAHSSFPDVDNNTHKEDINELVKSGILTGYPDGMFKPKKEITRGEAVTILARALKLEAGNKSSVRFTDVANDSYYHDAIAALVEAKIIDGFNDNTFRPDDTLTREQMAKILGVAYDLSSNASSAFTDVNKNSYAYAYINGLYEAAITLGVSDTAFNPTGHVTREQMASFVNRAMQHKQEHIISGEVKQISNDSVQIGNVSYLISKDLLTAISPTFLKSLENANVTVAVKNNKIITFNEIHINEETKNFDGSGLTLDQLTFKEGVNTLRNVDAKKIEIATTQPSLELTNINSEELNITKRKILAASLNVFAVETDFTVEFNEQNNISNVIIDADSLTYAASNQTSIEQLQLVNTKQVTLNSTVAKLQLNESIAISGTGQIKQLEILNKNAKIVLSNTITVGEYIFENKFYKFEQLEALGLSVQFTNEESTQPVDPDGNNGATTTPDQGSVEPTPSIPNESGSTVPVNPDQGGGSGSGSTSSNPDQGTGNSAQTPSTPGENTNNGSTTPSDGDTSTIVQDGEVALGTPASVVTTDGDKVSIKINNANVKVSDVALASLLQSEQLQNISSMDVMVENNAVVGVKALTFTATENTPVFNANNLQVEQLTISGANDVQNVTVTSGLTINTDGAVALTNVQLAPQATVNISGEVTAISGIESAQSLAVNTSAQALVFNPIESLAADVSIMAVNAHTIDHLNTTGTVTVTSGNNDLTLDIQASKLILEEPKIATYKFVKVAAFSMMPFATANQLETKITINNGNGDLIINRKQTLLDIQGNSYSTVEVGGTGNSLYGDIAHLATTAAVGYLTIFGNVNTMAIDGAETSLVITGGGTIGTLTVSNSKKQIIDISGVTVTTANDPDGSIITATAPNLPDLAVSFDTATKLGHYPLIANINSNNGEKLKFVQLKEGETIALDTVPSTNVETYDGTSAFIQYDTKNLAVFLVDSSNNLLKSTLIPAPTGNHSQITGFENKQIKFNSAFNKDTSLQSFAKYAYVFSGGKLIDSIPSLAGTAKYDAAVGYATWSLQTSLSTLKDVIIVLDNLTYTGSPTEATTVKVLQTMAAEAVANDNPMMLYRPVTALLSYKEGIVIDQNLLEIYAERIAANPASYNSVTALKSLVEEVADEIKYDQDVVPSLSTLLLEDDNVTFTSANPNIVTATATNGQILLMPGTANGTTLLTAQDGAGNITKVAVQVDGGKIAQFVPQMFEQTDAISILYGDTTKYRTKTDATGKKFIIPEIDSTLIVRDSSGTGIDLQKLSFNTLANPVDLTLTTTALTAVPATLAELGLTAATVVENANVGTIVEGTNVWFYPITTTETNLKLTDSTNTTAVNTKPNATTVDIEIAKIATPLNIAADLGLTNVEKVSNTANTTKIHGKATATEFTLFANDAATAAFTVEDGSGKKTLLNAQSLSTNGKVTIGAPEIIVHSITESATVYSYSENKVRIAGNKIYPIESGTAKVTLTDGTIYTIETSLLNNVYTSTVTKETAFKIDAAALGLVDILSATENIVNGTATIANKQTVNNKELIFTMTDIGTAEVIVTATDGSKTLFYVTATKTNDTVSYSAAKIINANVTKAELGFTGITGTVDSTKTYARTTHTNDDVTIYGYTAGKQAAEIYNGAEKALVNIETIKDSTSNQLTVTAKVVDATLAEAIHADATGGSIIRIAADDTLYAMNEGTTEIQVTSSNNDVKRYAQVTVSKDAVSGHYKIVTPTYIEKRVLSMDELGLTSIATATSNKSNIQTAVDGEEITITKTSDSTETARITVTGTNGETTYVHVTTNFEVIVEKSNTIDLAAANLENITATEWLNGTTVRAVTNNTSVTFYSLLAGHASFKVTDSKGKTAIINITDEAINGAKTKKAEIVQASLPTGETGTLIAGDALRVGDDGNTLFAQKAGTARILANGKVYEYTITEAASQYTISAPTIIADVLTINLSTKLGFTSPNSVKVENEAVATASISGDLLTVYKKSSGQTPISVTDATGKTFVFNLNTADTTPANWLDVTVPVKLATALTASPTLLHAIEDVGIIKAEANAGSYDVYAQKFGDVEVLYDGKIHRISVKNEQGVATVAIEEISSAIIKKAELGLFNSLEIPSIYNQDDYFITKIGDDLVAYAKTPSSKQEVTITDGTTNKTVLNLEANAAGYTTYSVAKEENVLTTPADYGLTDITSFTIKADKPYVRYNSNTLYALQQGETYATLSDGTNKALAAISVTRDATTNQLTAAIAPIKKSATDLVAGATTIEAMPNSGTDTSIVDIRGNILYATGLGTTFVRVDNYVVEVTIGMNPNTEKFEMTAIPMKSATVTNTQLGLDSITSYDLSANAAQVVQTVQNGNTLIFYGKAAGSAQVTVTQTDGITTWNGLINLTVAANGDITATPVKYNAAITAPVENTTVTMQNDQVRAIWNGTNVELYAVSEGKSSIVFDKGALNVEVKKDSTTGAYSFVGTPTFASTKIAATDLNVIAGSEFAHIEEIGGETVLVAKEAGKVVLLSADTIYEVTISNDANGHVSISAPTALPFKSLDIIGSYTIAGNAVSSMEANIDTDPENELIVYPTDTNGTSDIHFTSGTNQTTYQVTVNNNVFESASPKLAQVALNSDIADLTTTSAKVRIDAANSKLLLNVPGNAYLQGSNGFVNVTVARDANGYFTATQATVIDTLTEALVYPTVTSANYRLDGNNIYPLTTTGAKVLYTATKRVELATKVENDQIVFSKVEQDMEIIPYADYNLTTPTIEANTFPTVAKAELRGDGALVVYALNAGTTTITVKDGDNTLSIYATVDENKNLTTTIAGQSAAINLADIGITGTVTLNAFEVDTNSVITLSPYSTTKVQPTISNGVIRFAAKETGKTSFAIAEENAVKAFVNVEVYRDTNNQLAARTTVIETNVDIATATKISGTDLFRTYNGKHYATGVGTAVYKTAEGEATIVRIGEVQIDENTKTVSHSAAKRHLIEFATAADYDLTAIDSAIIADTTVVDGVALNGTSYIYAKNNGVTDVLFADNANNKAVVQVTNTNGTLTSKVAKESLPTDVAGLNSSWTDANDLLQVRNGSIYALSTGITTIKDSNGVLANVTVQRDTTLPFKTEIELPKVQPVAGQNVTVISGADAVHIAGDTVYAKAVGKAKVQVNGIIQEVEVKQLANGHYTIEAVPAKVQVHLNATELGLDTITGATITSNIISTDLQNIDATVGNELILLAEQAGTAVLTVTGMSNNETVQTKVQVTVNATNNVLSFETPIIATTKTGVPLEKSIDYTNNSIVRAHNGMLFALAAGDTFVRDASGILYKVKAEQTDALRVAVSELAYTFENASKLETASPDVVISDKKVSIKKLGITADLSVNDVTYRLTVDADGQISVQSLAQNTVDLSEVFDGTKEITANATDIAGFLKVTQVPGKAELTLEPLQTAAAEKEILVTSNGQTVQLLVKVASEGDGYKATAELISKQFAAADIGFHMDEEEFTLSNGIAKVVGGVLKVYPGEVGKQDFIVQHTVDSNVLRKTIMRLDVTGLNQFTVGKLAHTVTDATFTDATKVIAQQGTALATGGTDMTITNFDGSSTLFIVNGSDGYRQFKVSTTLNTLTNTYDIVQTAVQRPYEVVGDVTNVNGTFYTAKDDNNTIIFSNTSGTGSAIVNGVIHNLIADNTANNLVTASPVVATLTGDYTFVAGTDNLTKQADGTWVAKAQGTAYYKNTAGYKKVTVALNTDNQYEVSIIDVAHQTLDAAYSNITLLKHPAEVFVDGHTIYGEVDTSNIVVSAFDGESRVLLTGSTLSNNAAATDLSPLKLDVLNALGWTNVDSWVMNSGNNVGRIEKNDASTELYIQNFGNFKATFKAASGVTKTLEFDVDANYNISPVTVGNNTISYELTLDNNGTTGNDAASAFNITFDLTFTEVSSPLKADPSNPTFDMFAYQNVAVVTPINGSNYNGQLIITTTETPNLTAVINATAANNTWNVTVTDSNTDPTTKVEFIEK